MQGDDIREQIESLRQEVRGLSTSILNLRQDDMRKVFGDQIKSVLMDRIARHYSQAPGGSAKERGEASEKEFVDLVDRSVTIFQEAGKQKALRFVDEFESGIVVKASGNDDRTRGFELQLVTQIREYLMLSDQIFNQKVPDITGLPSIGMDPIKGTMSPEAAERLLAPVSNARRVRVMMILSRESNSLAELSKELDLKKGHLQFHLKALLDVDYILYDRKSRLYSITPRGTLVLDGVARLMDDLTDNVVE
ncbi:MAG: winged helix-turn-helix domain-containing protein [Methanomassiliicoccales archaeon]|jgi:DNA-binding transcriptional ArsR family regulator